MNSHTSSQGTGSHQGSGSSAAQPASTIRTIAVVGSINMDHILRVSRFPRNSETLITKTCERIPGGKGAMQALACYKLLRKETDAVQRYRAQRRSSAVRNSVEIVVELHARIGSDKSGKAADSAGIDVVEELRDLGLATDHIQVVPGAETGRAFVIVNNETGENQVIVYPGANQAPDVPIPFPENTIDLCIFQLEIEAETVWSHILAAKDRGAKVLLNAAPAPDRMPEEIWENLDHLIVNEIEADMLISNHFDPSLVAENTHTMSRSRLFERYQEVCKVFLSQGVQNVVVTLGEHGCVAGCIMADGDDFLTSYKVPRVENVIDRTGAGGVFVGAYAVDYVRQMTNDEPFAIKDAIVWACKAARLSVQKQGSIDGIPTSDQVEDA